MKPGPHTEQHLDRALYLVQQIRTLEQSLDPLFFSRTTSSIAPPPDNFFRNYIKRSHQPVRTALPPSNFGHVIGDRIRQRREERNLTQNDLANATRIRRPNIARLEKGQGLPNLSTLLRIAEGLHIPLSELLTY